MEGEIKRKWYKNEWDMIKGWVMVLIFILVVLGVSVLTVGLTAVSDYHAVKAFNNIHGTNYTFGEWFWAKGTIKDYHLGTVENKNYNVDLNLNQPIN